MKKALSILLAMTLALLTAACSSTGGQQPASSPPDAGEGTAPAAEAADPAASSDATYTLKASTYVSDAQPLMALIRDYADYVLEQTGGDVNIVIYPSEQLGGYEATFEETMRGTIEMGFNSVASSYDIMLSCPNLPGFVQTPEELAVFLQQGNTVFNTVDAALDNLNIKLLGSMSEGFFNLLFSGDLEEGYLDPSVKKNGVIRVPSGQDSEGQVEALGYNSAALPGVEVYSGLQTGVINGSVGQPDSMILTGYSDVVDHVVDIRLTVASDWIFINKDVFASLPAEYQQVLLDAGERFAEQNIELIKTNIESDAEQLEQAGVNYIHMDPQERSDVLAVVREACAPLMEQKYGAEFIASVKNDLGME